MNTIEEFYKDKFIELYYYRNSWAWSTSWLGISTLKCPLDLWIYQEIIYEKKPDWIIECGTHKGGSALFLASVCDQLNHGKIITIDIVEHKEKKDHPRINYLIGSSTSKKMKEKIKSMIKEDESVMVILDSDHSKTHVLNELEVYAEFVSNGHYLIVEDTIINGHPVLPNFGDGPMEALEQFLTTTDQFVIDNEKEKFLLTFNSKGYLKKIK